MRKKIMYLAGTLLISAFATAQNKWDTDGNTGIGNNAKLGSKNNKGFSIITNNQPAVDVQHNGTFNFLKPVNFFNLVKFDSLKVLSYIDVDSIHCRTLKIGNSLTTNDAGPSYGSFRPFDQQLLNASNNRFVIEGATYLPFNATNSDDIRAVIGYLDSPNGPQHRFNVHSNFNNDVFSSFTNINLYSAPGTFAATDGFKVGILANGIAQINQQENLDLQFHTNNTQQMVIKDAGQVGINTNTPGNRLTITSGTGDFGFGSANGSSGLQLENLTSANTPLANPSSNVLSVDASGHVILVPDGSGGGSTNVTAQNGLSNISPSIIEWGGKLLHDTYVDQDGYNIFWHNPGSFTLGNSNAISSSYKFGLDNKTNDYGQIIFHDNSQNPSPSSLQAALYIENIAPNSSSSGINLGHYTKVSGGNDNRNLFYTDPTGVFGGGTSAVVAGSVAESINAVAYHADITIGGAFGAFSGDVNATRSLGVEGQAYSGKDTRGVSGIVYEGGDASSISFGVSGSNSASDGNCYGVYGYVAPATVNSTGNYYGVYGSSFAPGATVAYAGFFAGDVFVTGDVTANAYQFSDKRLKTNIADITNSRKLIDQLQGKSYYYDTTRYFLEGKSAKSYGLIAQEVEQVLPELVGNFTLPDQKDSLGNVISTGGSYKSLNYDGFIGILLANAKEQQIRIDSLITAINAGLGAHTDNSSNTAQSSTTSLSVNKQSLTLSNADAVVLNQNQPNPFSESTVIKYNVPEKYGYAQMVFTTAEGRILKTIDITKKGPGEITVFAEDLSSGIYHYSLVVDGKTMDTKKMVKQ